MHKEFIIEINGENALAETVRLTKVITDNDIPGVFVEQVRQELKAGEMSVGELMPYINGALIVASVPSLFKVLTTYMQRVTNRESIRSDEKIAKMENESRVKKVVLTTTDDEGKPIIIDFLNYDEEQIERFLKILTSNGNTQ